jgi:hypothetical protein
MGDTLIDTDGMVDAAGNRFSLIAEAQPGNSNITFATLKKITPQGVTTDLARFLPAGNQKIDKANLARSGQDVIVEVITHEVTSIKPRRLEKQAGVIRGVFVTNPQFEAEESGPGAFVGGGSQEVDVDYERIENIVRSVIGLADASVNLKQEFSGSPTGNFRQALEDKNKDAIREERVMTEAMFAGGSGSHIVYEQLVNTSYTGALGALNEFGGPPPQEPEADEEEEPTE